MAIYTDKQGKTHWFLDLERTGETDFVVYSETVYTTDNDGNDIQQDDCDLYIEDGELVAVMQGAKLNSDPLDLIDDMSEDEIKETLSWALGEIQAKLKNDYEDTLEGYASDQYDSYKAGDISYSAASRNVRNFERGIK
jgi:hypothetical protein